MAKNDKFQHLVSQVANSLLINQKEKSQAKVPTFFLSSLRTALFVVPNSKVVFDKDALSALPSCDDASKTLADVTALCIGSVGENVVLRRGVLFNLQQNQLLGSYCHGQINSGSSDACRMGKYGALVNYSQTDSDSSGRNK